MALTYKNNINQLYVSYKYLPLIITGADYVLSRIAISHGTFALSY